MIVEFLNVWGGRTGNTLKDYLREEAKRVQVFCFQEADKDFPKMAEEILGGSYRQEKAYKFVTHNDIFPQSTWVRKDLEIINVNTVLEDVPGVGLGLRCEVQKGLRRINLVNFHGVSRPTDKKDCEVRLTQSRELIREMRCMGGVVVGGDFNTDNGTKSMAMFSEAGYQDMINENHIRTTRNELAWMKFPDTPQLHSNFVFVSPDVRVKGFTVVENLVSDHLPMVLEIED